MANFVFNYIKQAMLAGSLNVQASGAGKIYCMLVGSGYAPDIDTHVYRSSVTNEITGTYTAGGFALSAPLFSTSTTNNQGIFDANDVFLATVTFGTIPAYAVLYSSSGLGVASDPLIAAIDLVTYNPVTAGTFQIQWASGGILAIT